MRGKARWVLGAVTAAVVVVALVVVVLNRHGSADGFWSGKAPSVREDHTTTRGKPAVLPQGGPPPGAMAMSWHVDIDTHIDTSTGASGRKGPVHFAVRSGQVVVATWRRLTAYDARTGAERWHYAEAGRLISDFALTAGSVVVLSDDESRREPSAFTGLDAISGRTLWRHGAQITQPTRFATSSLGFKVGDGDDPAWAAGSAGGVVPVTRIDPGSGETLAGIDAHTGKTRWLYAGAGGCRPLRSAVDTLSPFTGDVSLVVAVDRCGTAQALDTRTGTPSWHRALPARTKSIGIMPNGITWFDTDADAGPLMVNAAGRDIGHVAPGAYDHPQPLGVAGGQAVLIARDDDAVKWRFDTIDTTSGDTEMFPLRGGYFVDAGVASTASTLYGFVGRIPADRYGRPDEVVSVDPVGRRLRYSPIPSLTPWPGTLAPDNPEPVWAAGDAGKLFVAFQPDHRRYPALVRLASYSTVDQTGPTDLGGVPSTDWPDPCGLWPGHTGTPAREDFYSDDPGRGYTLNVGSATIPHKACFFRDHGAEITLREIWTARTPAEAKAFLVVDPGRAKPVAAGDEAYMSIGDDDSADQLIMRAGRTIIALHAQRARGDRLTAIARDVATALSNR